ncbi:protein of unknown function [Shinella sp. WSC3-e]|nr:protein of unknown function [Shinella sp. WSC3-e]
MRKGHKMAGQIAKSLWILNKRPYEAGT